MRENLSVLDMLNLFSIFLQMENYESDLKQASNSDIMNALQAQDNRYLKKILENQEKIISMLEHSKPTK